MKYVLYYETGDDVMTTAPRHVVAHREHWQQYRENGTLLMIGPFADPRDGAMAVFTTREAAEAFAQADPFVVNGVAKTWTVREWNEALTP